MVQRKEGIEWAESDIDWHINCLYCAVLCTVLFACRYDFYEKAVTFKPYQVDMLDPVTANFLGDNLRCWMQIQVSHSIQIFFVVNYK